MLRIPRGALAAGLGRVGAPGQAAVDSNSAPLTLGQVGVIARCAARELRHGLRDVSAEVARWRLCGAEIDSADERHQVLEDLRVKRSYLNGSAYFNNLLPRRAPKLVQLLVAFQVLANYLDTVSERNAARTGCRPNAWTAMLRDAVVLDHAPRADLYDAVGPEGQYLRELVEFCRGCCRALPSYDAGFASISHEAHLAQTLDLEHDPRAGTRSRNLQRFINGQVGQPQDLAWWELAAGASSALTLTVALTLTADPSMDVPEVSRAVGAYRYVASLAALLDNYVDLDHDRHCGANNYILAHADPVAYVERLRWLIQRALAEVQRLREPQRHTLLVANMIAMFLSSDEARSDRHRRGTERLITAGGTTTRALVPILRVWRVAHRQPSG